MGTGELYPLKFEPIYKEKLWGGDKIRAFLGKDFSPLLNCGESWELSAVVGNISRVANGRLKGIGLDALIGQYGESLLGEAVREKYGDEFPLLIKFVDAHEDLSIQVHPDEALAKKRYNMHGKSEMWYVLHADEGASLINGFNRPLDKETYLAYFNNLQLQEILHRVPVAEGDVFYIPGGRIHTIGKGILLAEVQQTSDITYRIYDFDRVDTNGNKRELHTEMALEALDFSQYEAGATAYHVEPNEQNEVVDCPYFTTNKLLIEDRYTPDYCELDSFVVYICTKGEGELVYEGGSVAIRMGDVYLIPAALKDLQLTSEKQVELLEVYIS